jgi:hypothetical protein
MDPDVRSKTPGKCPLCGMTLQPGIPQPVEYPMDLKVTPPQIPAGREITLEFRIRHPKTGAVVKDFEVIHEKLFHLFLVSQDLEYFAHLHPDPLPDGGFRLKTTLPKPGTYRLLADFDPKGGTPQLAARTFTTARYTQALAASIPHPGADLAPKKGANLEVELTMEPPQPIAGKKTLLFLQLQPATGLEPYIGAWAHLLAVSNDLIDTIHSHPFIADGGPRMQFNIFFPREAVYRIWIQFQRKGVVNTVAFTVPVRALTLDTARVAAPN